MYKLISLTIVLALVTTGLCGLCYDPSPAFPIPQWSQSGPSFPSNAFEELEAKLKLVLANPKYDVASTSIQLTSSSDTLWFYYHSAPVQNKTRPGTSSVDGDSQYRIASITKTFTTLAILQLHAAGKLDINDPVNKYIPELAGKDSGKIPWKDITLRAMASQLSGLPREFGQSDLLTGLSKPWQFGLPPASDKSIPPCFRNNGEVCTTEELLHYAKTYEPLFAPNQESTYSNLNFELLGIVIENVTGGKYDDYIEENILNPLHMSQSSLRKPSDKHAVIPDSDNWWDTKMGALKPTGGIYSTTNDLSKFLRYVLTHYNALVTGVNWFQPASFSSSLQTSYGMPWEIFRTNRILLNSNRPVSFITKSGGVPGYFTIIAALPEYNLGITILTAGPPDLITELIEAVTTSVTRAAEDAVWTSIADTNNYTGRYVPVEAGLNSSFAVTTSAQKGIALDAFISNGTDVLNLFGPGLLRPQIGDRPWHVQLIPTLLYKNESSQQGEIFRLLFVPERDSSKPELIWDDFCSTDIDTPGTYAGLPSNEVVFWHEREEVELPAWRVVLKREAESANQEAGLSQQVLLF